MKPMDLHQFEKWIKLLGCSIKASSKHHVILNAEGQIVEFFAISHKAGGKKYVKPIYIKRITQKLGE